VHIVEFSIIVDKVLKFIIGGLVNKGWVPVPFKNRWDAKYFPYKETTKEFMMMALVIFHSFIHISKKVDFSSK